jgi:hypothetical protein
MKLLTIFGWNAYNYTKFILLNVINYIPITIFYCWLHWLYLLIINVIYYYKSQDKSAKKKLMHYEEHKGWRKENEAKKKITVTRL